MSEITAESLLRQLGQPLPEEGKQKMYTPDGKQLVGYRPQYYIDRLNETFPFDWDFDICKDQNGAYMIFEKDGCVGCFCILTLYTHDAKQNRQVLGTAKQWGAMIIDDSITWADAYKGAMSNALCKCCANFGLGGDAQKGLVSWEGGAAPEKAPAEISARDRLMNEIRKEAKVQGLTKETLQKIARETLDVAGKVTWETLTEPQLQTILDAITQK